MRLGRASSIHIIRRIRGRCLPSSVPVQESEHVHLAKMGCSKRERERARRTDAEQFFKHGQGYIVVEAQHSCGMISFSSCSRLAGFFIITHPAEKIRAGGQRCFSSFVCSGVPSVSRRRNNVVGAADGNQPLWCLFWWIASELIMHTM